MFQRILLPVDGSDCSKRACKYALELAKKFDSEIVLLHAFELPIEIASTIMGGYASASSDTEDLRKSLEKFGNSVIQGIKKEVNFDKISVKELIKQGRPGQVIVDSLEEENISLIVMGSRGLGELTGLILGSVSSYVLQHSRKPVFITR